MTVSSPSPKKNCFVGSLYFLYEALELELELTQMMVLVVNGTPCLQPHKKVVP